ncbi:MAG TPA: protein kinase [Ktedonobacterales bacterium]|nr:protein kinase [Ktedonobacterales bacterium]
MGWSDLIGRTLGDDGDDDRYEIVEELGRGGSGRVYRARDRRQDRDVAIKVLPNDAEDRQGFIRRFEREAQAVEQLHHPNIVAVYDRGKTEELVYLVMQCVTGGTLRARLGKPLPPAEAAGAIIQMAHALHHAHQHGVIHRDVKPSNMLVDAEDPRRLLLTDFGIAKITGMRGLTKSGTTIGTPEYMAPEQAEGHDVDHRADVYALGCVLFEALTGKPPFTANNPVSVLYQQVHSRPPYIRGLIGETPAGLARVVQQALAKRPDERFGTAEALAQALYPFTESRDVSFGTGAWPQLAEADGTVAGVGTGERPSDPTGRRWGAEGLDALFPNDPEARIGRLAALAQSPTDPLLPSATASQGEFGSALDFTEQPTLPSDTPSLAVPISERHTQPPIPPRRKPATIPIAPLRLPAKPTQPLDLPTTPDGKLDVEALMAQVEREHGSGTPPPAGARMGAGVCIRRAPLEPRQTLGPGPAGSTADPPGSPSRLNVWERDEPPRGGRRGGRGRRGGSGSGNGSRGGGRSLRLVWAAAALAAALILSVTIWVGVSASGLGIVRAPTPTHAPTATASATATATATATNTPKANPTATPDVQKQLNAQAAASFRAVTLTGFADNSCAAGDSRTSFSAPATVYVNLCASGNVAPGPVTVTLRQNGQTFAPMAQNIYVSPGASYYFYRYGLGPGSYDMLVTMTLQGQTATARDVAFTVG